MPARQIGGMLRLELVRHAASLLVGVVLGSREQLPDSGQEFHATSAAQSPYSDV